MRACALNTLVSKPVRHGRETLQLGPKLRHFGARIPTLGARIATSDHTFSFVRKSGCNRCYPTHNINKDWNHLNSHEWTLHHVRTNVSIRRNILRRINVHNTPKGEIFFSLVCTSKKAFENFKVEINVQGGPKHLKGTLTTYVLGVIQFMLSSIITILLIILNDYLVHYCKVLHFNSRSSKIGGSLIANNYSYESN